MDSEITIGTFVTIDINGKSGRVRAIWYDIEGATKYRVRYVNEVGSVIDDWFVASDLTVTAAQPA